MNALVNVSSTNQDLSLAGALESVLVAKKWKVIDNLPLCYSKKFKADLGEAEIIKQVKADLKAAIVQTDWANVTYLLTLSENAPKKISVK
jgi:hypothetical protein